MQKTIGIIGGMGPAATYDLFRKIIEKTDAKTDQEHIHICIDCNTNIPDRTKAILGNGEDPVPELVRSGIRLQGMGADVLLMPCNTAHYFYERITPFLDVPLLNMLQETARHIERRGLRKVGLLATDGTLRSGVYHRALSAAGIETLTPPAAQQAGVMELIYQGVKANNRALNPAAFQATVDELVTSGAEALVLGCTELPLAFEMYDIHGPTIDPTAVLAEAAIRFVNVPLLQPAS